MADWRFEIGLVVATHEKAKSLAPALGRLVDSERAPIHICVIPELIQLIAPEPLDF
jgi:hypothetical protein